MNKRIALIRKEKDHTQDEFAEKLGLTKNFISLIENGKREPSDRTIKDICRIFGADEIWLRTGKGEMFVPDRERDLAELTAGLFIEEPDSFKNRFISMLARMTDEEWSMLEAMVEKLSKKE